MIRFDQEITIFNGTTPNAAGTHAETGKAGFAQFDRLSIVATITGATGGSLDVYVQRSADGVTWYDLIHFPSAAAADAAVTYVVDCEPANDFIVIGTGTSPALDDGGVAGMWSDRLRVVEVSGTGVSTGAALVVKALAGRASL